MQLTQAMSQRVHIAAHLHDIGKIGVCDNSLNKAGKLTTAEMADMQMHPRIGFNILQRLPSFREIARIVLHHHERWDGRGYPDGLRGEAIPPESRIIAVADAFDAMTSDRPYRTGISVDDAAAEIYRHAGEQFDDRVVAPFNQVYRSFQPHVERRGEPAT